jgi:hypothetical protein
MFPEMLLVIINLVTDMRIGLVGVWLAWLGIDATVGKKRGSFNSRSSRFTWDYVVSVQRASKRGLDFVHFL